VQVHTKRYRYELAELMGSTYVRNKGTGFSKLGKGRGWELGGWGEERIVIAALGKAAGWQYSAASHSGNGRGGVTTWRRSSSRHNGPLVAVATSVAATGAMARWRQQRQV
jgi:hypothetical protein